MNKIISRIKGGLGNQLFCYAAARRLALVNDAELIIDNVTGFIRDSLFCRRYMLDHFSIPARKATSIDRLEPFDRYRRYMMNRWSRRKTFAERRYLTQEGSGFDERLLMVRVTGTLYLDGVWESESYFKDVEDVIRKDLQIIPPTDALNQHMAEEISNSNAVALHVRCFDSPNSVKIHNVSDDYYQRAIALMEEKIKSPCYFVFSDDPSVARTRLSLPSGRVMFVSHNRGDENAYADLWLMALCKHFITANSTFSWWGAWLCDGEDKIVVTPRVWIENHKGLLPKSWMKL